MGDGGGKAQFCDRFLKEEYFLNETIKLSANYKWIFYRLPFISRNEERNKEIENLMFNDESYCQFFLKTKNYFSYKFEVLLSEDYSTWKSIPRKSQSLPTTTIIFVKDDSFSLMTETFDSIMQRILFEMRVDKRFSG